MTDLRYPVGRLTFDPDITGGKRTAWIRQIAEAPAALRAAVDGLTEAQLDRPYRPEGWTVRQVVHHLPDSHLNAYIRFKLALTEDNPTIKPYEEARWAELPDGPGTPVGVSLMLLESLHRRWMVLLKRLTTEQWERTFVHPEKDRPQRLDHVVAMYAWHGKHHIAHITALRDRMAWR